MWYVYILECKNGKLYTGITKDPDRRFKEHEEKSARYTSYNPPARFVHTETYLTRSEAQKRECRIKRLRRDEKLALIDGKNH
ncbi:MAG: GIY-YIG nuclease family protein [Candidatus Omnitrophica bacterium]|nr:GIY-YIG nuclease family protein [Candidatus Omnitrophota bacterium]